MFIAYALYRTRLHPSTTFAARFLMQRLKTRFVAARGSPGHRLSTSAFTIPPKVTCGDTYPNKPWCIVGQGIFALREINQMEREMCSHLEWQLNVDPSALKEFEAMVRRDFKGLGPYCSSYLLPAPVSGPFAHPKSSTNPTGTVIPSFGPVPQPPSSSPPKPSSMPPKTSPPPVHPHHHDSRLAIQPFSGDMKLRVRQRK
jgi:Cyclin, N-terminal domain